MSQLITRPAIDQGQSPRPSIRPESMGRGTREIQA